MNHEERPSTPRRWTAVAGILRASFTFDRALLRPGAAVRPALGVAIVLGGGVALGQDVNAVIVVIGALAAGFASFQGNYRTRVRAVLWTGLAMAVSAFVGCLAAHHVALLAFAVLIWAFGAGLVVAVGQVASIVGLQAMVALLVLGQYPLSPIAAATKAGLVLSGAVLQALLVTATWSFRRYDAERGALGAAYRGLARYAETLPPGAVPDPDSVAAAWRALADPQPFGAAQRRTAYHALVDEAERIRTTLAALDRARDRLAAAGHDAEEKALVQLVAASADVLESIAAAAQAGPREHRLVSGLDVGVRLLREDADRGHPAIEAADPEAAARLRTLVRHLGHAVTALRSTAAGGDEPAGHEEPSPADRLPAQQAAGDRPTPFSAMVETLRANLTFGSAAYRHAVRLSVTATGCLVLAHLVGIPRGYWVPLTALVVLRPDYASTVTRGVGRIVGTLLGATLATLVASLLHPDHTALTVGVVVAAWLAYTLLRASYATFAVALTGYVVFLLAFLGLPEPTVLAERGGATLLGGAIALIAFAVWPTWEATAARGALAAVLRAQAAYGASVLAAYVDPAERDPAVLRAARGAARLARSNAEASLSRLRGEPHRDTELNVEAASRLLEAGRGYALAALTLHAGLATSSPLPAEPVRRLTDAVRARLEEAAAELDETSDGDRPDVDRPLRELLDALPAGFPLARELEALVDAATLASDEAADAATPTAAGSSSASVTEQSSRISTHPWR